MYSKLTIDFGEEMQPVLRLRVQNSDDVRDKLAKAFIESLGHESNLLAIKCTGINPVSTENREYEISPIKNSLTGIRDELIKLYPNKETEIISCLLKLEYED